MDAVKAVLFLTVVLGSNCLVSCKWPAAVNIGAIVSYDSVIGRVAKAAIEAAVADVNSDKNVLGWTRLNLTMIDSACNPFVGAIGALNIFEKDAVAIIGPQASSTAHMISVVADGLQIPLVSFAATDPTLSPLQHPFFLRMTQSDSYQMAAVADFISSYGWRQVIGVYVDNDYGRNGIESLANELAKRTFKMYKVALPLGNSTEYMKDALRKSRVLGPRVYVLHATPDSGLDVFSVAQQLQMMTDEYVWLVTDWLCTALYSSENSLNRLQGIVGVCQYVPDSSQKSAFSSKWEDLRRKGMVTSKLNVYGLYAYDTVWAVARAIDAFLKDSGTVTFTSNNDLRNIKGIIQLNKLKSFDEGHLLLQKLLRLNFTGIIGQIQFTTYNSLKSATYQIVNIDGNAIRTVGYWVNHLGLTVSLPKSLHGINRRNFSENQVLGNITWIGGQTKTPRGWVVATSDKPLRIAVPHRVSFVEFVTVLEDNHTVRGYSIDVFEAALKLVPYSVPYVFVPFGDGYHSPGYWKLVNMVADQVVDGAVGDITIAKNRTRIVDFTQPYASSGLVIVVKVKSLNSAWVFLRPFSVDMWCVTGAYFFLIGFVIWLLEHRANPDFRGPPKKQFLTLFLFSFSSLFHSQKEDTVTPLARFVMVVWFFLLLVITSSYTASLTSFLTIQQLSSPINGIESLIASKDPIGFQESSFARIYMIDALKINPSRLIPLRTPEAYVDALLRGPANGGVAAIVDEAPYIDLFLKGRNGFGVVGPPFTKRGWGFAFPRGSPLPIDLSRAILQLSENGDLQKIHDRWFCDTSCGTKSAKSSEPYQLDLSNFRGLFLLCGIIIVACLFIFFLRSIWQFIRFKRELRDQEEHSSKGCTQMICNFLDFLDEKEEAIKHLFKQRKETSQLEVS